MGQNGRGHDDGDRAMPWQASLILGVVVAKTRVKHAWIDHSWRPVGVLHPAVDMPDWSELANGDDWTQYYAGSHTLTVHRSETESYLVNLADANPSVYVVMRPLDDDDAPSPCNMVVQRVTVSPYEALNDLDSAELIVERVPIPPDVLAWLTHFVEAHHVGEKFIKRQRDRVNVEEQKFGKEPIFLKRPLNGPEDVR